ncbi:hypothetical protein NFI96_003069, partial [Prochilodus magdalenae]
RTTRVHFERDHRVGRYVDAIIRHLERQASIQVVNNEEYDVRVLFCPIVSRAGTDIEAVLSLVRAGKPTIVMVLHHTFDSRAVIPSSSSYNREGLCLVDFLFSEDQGLLECERNNISFETAACYIERHAVESDGKAMSLWEILPMFAVVFLFLCLDCRHSSCYTTVGMISGFVGGMVKRRLVRVACGGAIGLAFMGLNARLHFEWDHRFSGLLDELIRRLKEQVSIQVVKGRQYEVRVLFCPIVSRAGTDIEAVLSRVKAHEPTIVIVLHHTFDPWAVIPSSSVYDGEGLILVDFLYSEDQGLLESPKNRPPQDHHRAAQIGLLEDEYNGQRYLKSGASGEPLFHFTFSVLTSELISNIRPIRLPEASTCGRCTFPSLPYKAQVERSGKLSAQVISLGMSSPSQHKRLKPCPCCCHNIGDPFGHHLPSLLLTVPSNTEQQTGIITNLSHPGHNIFRLLPSREEAGVLQDPVCQDHQTQEQLLRSGHHLHKQLTSHITCWTLGPYHNLTASTSTLLPLSQHCCLYLNTTASTSTLLSLPQHYCLYLNTAVSTSTLLPLPQHYCLYLNTAVSTSTLLSLPQHCCLYLKTTISTSTPLHLHLHCCLYLNTTASTSKLPPLPQHCCLYLNAAVSTSTLLSLLQHCCLYLKTTISTSTLLPLHLHHCLYLNTTVSTSTLLPLPQNHHLYLKTTISTSKLLPVPQHYYFYLNTTVSTSTLLPLYQNYHLYLKTTISTLTLLPVPQHYYFYLNTIASTSTLLSLPQHCCLYLKTTISNSTLLPLHLHYWLYLNTTASTATLLPLHQHYCLILHVVPSAIHIQCHCSVSNGAVHENVSRTKLI